jgi:phospholipase C
MKRLAMMAFLLACGCKHDDSKGNGGGPRDSGPSCSGFSDRRTSCEFKGGAVASETLGSCEKLGSKMPIEHVIVLMQENRSFDHYLGHLLHNGQDDVDVAPDDASNPSGIDGDPPIGWHHTDAYCFHDTQHEWGPSHDQYDDGKNDGFAKTSSGPSADYANDPTDPGGARAMGYYTKDDLPFYYDLASKFAISDRYFADVLGPTYPNRFYLYMGTSHGLIANAFLKDLPTIFGHLTDAGITWRVYDSDAPALLITGFAAPTGATAPIEQFASDAAADALPQVVFLDPIFLSENYSNTSEHPSGDLQVGQKWVRDQVVALTSSPAWAKSAMFITYDENGGLYDHVPPPEACAPDDTAPSGDAGAATFDRYGFRVPVYVVSPYAKPHFVSHVTHSHASILRFIEAKFDLPALTARDANSDAMLDMFDFDKPALLTAPDLADAPVDQAKLTDCQAKFP